MENQIAKPNLNHLPSIQIDSILKAKNSKAIEDATDHEIVQNFAYIYLLIGLREEHYPTKEQDLVTIGFLRKYYGQRRLMELRLAFEFAIKGFYDVDIRVFDNFSVKYLSTILNAYNEYLRTMKKELTFKEAEEVKQITYEISKEEKLADIEMYRTKFWKFIPTYIYDWMVELKMIDLSHEEKQKLYDKAIDKREQELYAEAMKGNKHEYKQWMNWKAEGFKDITDEEINRIDCIFKRLAVWIEL